MFLINHALNFQYPAKHLKVRYMLYKTFTCTNHYPSTCYAGNFLKNSAGVFSWCIIHCALAYVIVQECQHSTHYCHGLCWSPQNSVCVYIEIMLVWCKPAFNFRPVGLRRWCKAFINGSSGPFASPNLQLKHSVQECICASLLGKWGSGYVPTLVDSMERVILSQ